MLRGALDYEEIRLRELKVTRRCIWRRFERNPNETHLAARLKIIDDQIAQSNRHCNHDANKIDDSERAGVPKVGGLSPVAAVPKVGGLFLILAVSQRRES